MRTPCDHRHSPIQEERYTSGTQARVSGGQPSAEEGAATTTHQLASACHCLPSGGGGGSSGGGGVLVVLVAILRVLPPSFWSAAAKINTAEGQRKHEAEKQRVARWLSSLSSSSSSSSSSSRVYCRCSDGVTNIAVLLLSASSTPTRAGGAANVIGRVVVLTTRADVCQRRLGRYLGASGSSHRSSRPAVFLQTRCTSHGGDDANS